MSRVLSVAFEGNSGDFSIIEHTERSYFREVSLRKRPTTDHAFDLALLAGSGLYLSAFDSRTGAVPTKYFLHDQARPDRGAGEDPVHRLSPGEGEDLSMGSTSAENNGSNGVGRRDLIKRSAALGLISVPAMSFLAACASSDSGSDKKATAGTKTAKNPLAVNAT